MAFDSVRTAMVAGEAADAADVNTELDNLDTGSLRTAVLDEDMVAGQAVGVSNYLPSGRIAKALRLTLSSTLNVTSNGNAEYPNHSCPIGGDKFVFLVDQTSNDTLYAIVASLNLSTKAVTLGTEVAVTADQPNNGRLWAVCKLDTDKFIVFYTEDASTIIVKYRVGTVSGTTITFGTAATFFTATNAVTWIVADGLSTDKGIMQVSTQLTDGRAIAFTTSGTVATPGTGVQPGTNTYQNEPVIKKIATDKFTIVTTKNGSPFGYCQIGTVSGTTITFGTEVQFANNNTVDGQNDVVSPADNVLVIRYIISSQIAMIAATVSGTVPTFGTAITGVINATNKGGLYAESATSILVSGNTGASSQVFKLTLSGNTLTSVGIIIQATTLSGQLYRLIRMDNGYFIQFGVTSTTLTTAIQGMTNNYIGILQENGSRGDTKKILLRGGVDTHQTALIQGAPYQVNSSGVFALVSSNVVADNISEQAYGIALTDTKLLVGI